MTIIDEIKARVDIIELIQQDAGVKLRRSGKNWAGFCPFHANSHSPALIVFPDTQTWHCFGACNEGGTVIDWVLKKNPGYDVKEAIKDLAARASLPLNDMDAPDLKQRLATRAREDALTIAARLFARWLQEDQEALAYARSRGWDDETLVASRLGFSGRATAAQAREMRGEFDLYGIPHDSPDAVIVLGYRGDVGAWAQKHGLDPQSFKETRVHGMMDSPGLVYAHKLNGRIVYLSRRQLPGHDVIRHQDGTENEWKSFNSYAALAGEKVPYFNHMYLRDRSRIVIVEGQGDAITLGMWGIPAMALCGSAWKNLDEYIAMLTAKDDQGEPRHETIYFATDADTPGEAIVTGAGRDEGKFPLTTAFGPMLWVARWPKFKWLPPDGREKVGKDANDLAMYHLDNQIEPQLQTENVKAVFEQAEPIVLLAARAAGRKQGAERQKALDFVLPLIARMPTHTRNDLRLRLAKALFPEDLFPEYKGAPLRPFEKLVSGELKELKEDDNGRPAEIEETIGGWYPVNEDGTEGYLVEMMYEKQTGRAKFAFAHIWLNGKVTREISTANFLDVNGKRLMPRIDDNIRYGTVRLPSGLGEKKSTRLLLATIRLFIARYFLLDDDIHILISSLYALFTWVYDAFPYLPYLRARGAPGSGKSELMLLIGRVCYRMMTTAGLTSIAGFKGMAHLYKGTLMIDEVDSLASSKEDRGELRALLNVRAMREQARIVTMMDVLKPDGTHSFTPATTFVFGPTLLTMYGAFKDPATESRCLSFDLYKRDVVELLRQGIEPGVIPPSMETEAATITNDLLYWRLNTWLPRLEVEPGVKLTDIRVSPRMNQIMRPLKVLAHLQDDKELLEDLNLMAAVNYEEELKQMAGTFEALIFRAVLAVVEREEYAKYVHEGKLGKPGIVRYVLGKDLAVVANEVADAENYADPSMKKDKEMIKSQTVCKICREAFRLPIERAGSQGGGAAVVLDAEKIDIGKFRFGMDRMVDLEDHTPAVSKPKQEELDLG
jgi:hypothetical protein